MLKKTLVAVSVFAVLLLIALSWLTARYVDQEEINRARLEMQQLRASRDSILTVVAFKDSLQQLLQEKIDEKQVIVANLRMQVDLLEQRRQADQLTVRTIRKEEELQKRLEQTFPEMAGSDWGVTEVYNEEQDISLRYLLIPFWFSETFIIDHQNSLNYQAQRDKLLQVDSLQSTVIALKDSVFTLEKQKSEAFKAGYDQAYAKYDSLNSKYIALLQKPPQITFGIPQWSAILAGYGLGIGTAVLLGR